jgi:hypothetical protein
MKKIYLLLILSCSSFGLFAQTVSIIQNLGTSGNIVVGASNYHVSESIYTDAEVGPGNFLTAGSAIQRVNFFVDVEGTPATVTNFQLWMKNVPAGTTTFTSGAYTTAGYTQVYNGTLDISILTGGSVTLTTPFTRTAGTNLQLLIIRTDNVLHPGASFFASVGNSANVAANSTRRYNSAVAPVDGVSSLTVSTFRPAIQFVHIFPIDAGIVGFQDPIVSCYDAPQSMSVEVSNEGTTNIAAGAASVTLKVRGANTFTGTLTNAGIIAPGATEVITFNGINLSNAGDNIDTAYVTLAGDGTTYNDTIVTGTTTASTLGQVVSTFPIVEDAESTLPVFSYVQLVEGDVQLWGIQTGNYQNGDMDDPIIPRAPGTSFYLFDSYNINVPSVDFVSRLFSNCIKVPAQLLPNPAPVTTVSFWMSRDTLWNTDGFIDSLYLSVSTDKGQTWTRLLPGFQRNKPSGPPTWEQKVVDISAYAGQTIQLGFEGASDWGNVIGLDDITISFTGLAPVTLLSFDARRNGTVNELTWSTSQEQNTSKFLVERSTNGREFSEIGFVNAAGNSNVTRNYRFTDPSPVKGINYYRLRIVDNDNTFKYSLIKNVRNLGVADLSIAPNPVQQTMRITIDADKAEKATISITDPSGKRVSLTTANIVSGTNYIEVPVSNIAKGSYIVLVQLTDQTIVRKISKL